MKTYTVLLKGQEAALKIKAENISFDTNGGVLFLVGSDSYPVAAIAISDLLAVCDADKTEAV
jgi:hypothetical protein